MRILSFLLCLALGPFANAHQAEPLTSEVCLNALTGPKRLDCRYFSGYKPCGKSTNCDSGCTSFTKLGERFLIVHLEALGAVLRSTALLPAIRRQYPNAVITWVTKAPAHNLLAENKLIDRVLTLNADDLLKLRALEFDMAFVIDKSLASAGVIQGLKVGEVRGFVADPRNGGIVPANPEAVKLWEIGLSNDLKFFGNTESEVKLTHDALKLGEYKRDDYQVFLSADEQLEADARRKMWSDSGRFQLVGLNTGSAPTIAAKKLTVAGHREIIQKMLADSRFRGSRIVLLGGPEDTERNEAIGKGLDVIQSSTTKGLRDGFVSMQAMDAVFSGDSLGMHMAIGLKKQVVAWFGPTVAHEIELFGRGEAILTKAKCSPCWLRTCSKNPMCYDQVDYDEVLNALFAALQRAR